MKILAIKAFREVSLTIFFVRDTEHLAPNKMLMKLNGACKTAEQRSFLDDLVRINHEYAGKAR